MLMFGKQKESKTLKKPLCFFLPFQKNTNLKPIKTKQKKNLRLWLENWKDIAYLHSCKRLLWFVLGDPHEAAFWQQEQWICKCWQIFMMHIKQLASGDLCRSPTYSLLCSLSISVSAAQGQAALTDQVVSLWRPAVTVNCCHSGIVWRRFRPISFCCDACSSTQHPHAALWPLFMNQLPK